MYAFVYICMYVHACFWVFIYVFVCVGMCVSTAYLCLHHGEDGGDGDDNNDQC